MTVGFPVLGYIQNLTILFALHFCKLFFGHSLHDNKPIYFGNGIENASVAILCRFSSVGQGHGHKVVYLPVLCADVGYAFFVKSDQGLVALSRIVNVEYHAFAPVVAAAS
jgi:hypothetical protein